MQNVHSTLSPVVIRPFSGQKFSISMIIVHFTQYQPIEIKTEGNNTWNTRKGKAAVAVFS